MYTCLYYWLIAPLRGGVIDTPEREPAFVLTVHALDRKEYEVSLHCDEQGQPEFARCRVCNVESEAIPESLLPLLQLLKEHMLSSLRLTFRADAMLAEPSAVWAFVPEGGREEVKLHVQEFGSTPYDPQKTKDIFALSFNIRELMRLYVDGVDVRIPLQYRFLSLYKLIENRFRKGGHWDKKSLAAFLEPFASHFIKQGFTGTPASVLHGLRDRCAHIKTGGNEEREALGVTHLNHAAAIRVEKVLPCLRAICAAVVNERADGKFALKTEVVYEGPYRAADHV